MAMPCLQLAGISKSFGPVRALHEVDLTAEAGAVHALIGENGAGKSTLMNILAGVHPPDAGRILYQGRPYRADHPADARQRGVAMIHQELTLAPHLTVAENITLGLERTRFGFLRNQRNAVRNALSTLGHADLDLDAPVRRLSMGLQQIVEIARAFVVAARVVIMDEPTSSLSAEDTQALFRVIRRLKAEGLAVLYISHFLEEIREVADRYTVLRDGESVATGDMAGTSLTALVEQMVGRSLSEMFPRQPHAIGDAVLSVEQLADPPALESVSFTLRRGEILGLAGLVGAGRSETVRRLFGLESSDNGTMRVCGRPALRVAWMTPARALRKGLDLLSENRKEEGLATGRSMLENITLSSLGRFARRGLLQHGRERKAADGWRRQLGIRSRDSQQPVEDLSGGNQQKVALARILEHDSDILFLDEPTRGIDVGSKAEIARLIGALAARGKAIVLISSYLPELLGICDTLGVMHRGRLTEIRPVADWTETEVMRHATAGC